MVFWRSGRSIFPLLPPYGAHDPNGSQRVLQPLHPDDITPYLGLRARLSQIWLNRWTILLLLVLVRTLFAVSDLEGDMDTAKRDALSACTSVESMGSAMASMPHYMAQGINEITADGVEKAVNGLMSMLMLTVTGVEEIVVFYINVLTQTYLCLITLAVRGSVDVALGVIDDVMGFVNKTLVKIGDDIADVANTIQDDINKFIGGINTITSAFGSPKKIPQVNMSGPIEELEHIQLPSSITDSLHSLNKSIPTFTEVQDFTNNVIRLPFEELKKLINSSMVEYKFDRSVFPIPAKEQLTFCNDNDGIDSFFDGVADMVRTARKIFIAVIAIAAALACIPMAWCEIRRWRAMKDRSVLVRKDAHDPMDVVYIVSRPYTSTVGIKAASHFSNSRRQILVRWAFAYATSTSALFVLSLGVAGLFACLCQFLLLRAVQQTVPELTGQVSQFADKVVSSLNNASEQWAIGANKAIDATNRDINQKVFGWVNTSTHALNDTLNAFVDKTTDVLNGTFGKTPLYGPLMDVFECLIGLKIQGIQKGLTWVSDHAHIDFPHLPNDTFTVGAVASLASDNPDDSFLANPGDEASDKISAAVVRVVDKIEDGILTEALISAALVGVWALVALLGILRALTLFWRREKNRGDGGRMPPPSDHNINNPPDPNGFTDVPLSTVHDNTRDYDQPVPGYSSTVKATGDHAVEDETDYYQDEKLGFAGHRNYDSGLLKVPGTSPAVRVSSYYGEYGSEKR